jgi:hypothetical protein
MDFNEMLGPFSSENRDIANEVLEGIRALAYKALGNFGAPHTIDLITEAVALVCAEYAASHTVAMIDSNTKKLEEIQEHMVTIMKYSMNNFCQQLIRFFEQAEKEVVEKYTESEDMGNGN